MKQHIRVQTKILQESAQSIWGCWNGEKGPFKGGFGLAGLHFNRAHTHTHTHTDYVVSSRVQMFPAARGHWSPPFTVNKALLQQWQLTYCNASGDGEERTNQDGTGWKWSRWLCTEAAACSGCLRVRGLKKKTNWAPGGRDAFKGTLRGRFRSVSQIRGQGLSDSVYFPFSKSLFDHFVGFPTSAPVAPQGPINHHY